MVSVAIAINRDPSRDGKESLQGPSAIIDEKILLDLANALSALGNHLMVANRIQLSAGSDSERLAQVLEKSRAQHERAVGATRELQKILQR